MPQFIPQHPANRLAHAPPPSGCDRRQFLRGMAASGLAAGALLAASGAAGQDGAENSASSKLPGFGQAKSVILVFANGGQSQLDMWDPKPLAPADVRGVFQPISTAVPGVQFCEHMPRIARLADRFTVVRSMSHEDIDHGSAAYLALTGFYHIRRSSNPAPAPTDMPTYGAVLRRLNRDQRFIYDAIHLNGPVLVPTTPSPGQDGGFLGRAFEPLVVGDVSSADGALPGLTPRLELPTARLSERHSLKQSLDQLVLRLESDPRAADMNRLYGKALELLASPRTQSAFQLEAEPDAVRDRYGRHRSGQALLLARRLVEAGVPWINVIWNHSNRGQDQAPDDTDLYGWDTHNDIFASLEHRLLP